ncbi:MAG: hypothetical protein FWC46_02070 [Actinomycetia bacterium]|nr:hypothetical protein [Actinomycetes bacterium]
MRDIINLLLVSCRMALDDLVNAMPGWARGAMRRALGPLYTQVDALAALNNGGGDPERLRAAATLFQDAAAKLLTFAGDTVTATNLKALNQPATWSDPDASSTYANEFGRVSTQLGEAVDWTSTLATALFDQSGVSDKYYSALNDAVVGFVVGAGGIIVAALGVANAETGVGAVAAAIGLVVALVAGLYADVKLSDVTNIRAAVIQSQYSGAWRKPSFADY